MERGRKALFVQPPNQLLTNPRAGAQDAVCASLEEYNAQISQLRQEARPPRAALLRLAPVPPARRRHIPQEPKRAAAPPS